MKHFSRTWEKLLSFVCKLFISLAWASHAFVLQQIEWIEIHLQFILSLSLSPFLDVVNTLANTREGEKGFPVGHLLYQLKKSKEFFFFKEHDLLIILVSNHTKSEKVWNFKNFGWPLDEGICLTWHSALEPRKVACLVYDNVYSLSMTM